MLLCAPIGLWAGSPPFSVTKYGCYLIAKEYIFTVLKKKGENTLEIKTTKEPFLFDF